MLHEEIRTLSARLTSPDVTQTMTLAPETWDVLCRVRGNLLDLADQVQQLEAHFVPSHTHNERMASA